MQSLLTKQKKDVLQTVKHLFFFKDVLIAKIKDVLIAKGLNSQKIFGKRSFIWKVHNTEWSWNDTDRNTPQNQEEIHNE